MNKSSIHAQQVLSTCHNEAFVNPKKTDSIMLTIESQINLCDFFSYTLYIYKVKEKRVFEQVFTLTNTRLFFLSLCFYSLKGLFY